MKNFIQALKELKEEKPGLWANIRAKKARGAKPAHKNSNAHKDAVKAGKKINKMSERIRFLSPEKQKANDAAFDKRMATLKDLEKGIKLHKAGKISDEELHNLKLKAGTISANSKFTKNEGTAKSAEELKSHIEALSKARAQAASKGQTTLIISYHKEISKAQKQLKKLTP
ncbi:hypothetical protein N9H35_00525 [bacterium]|nr:hypothetical protein [bacterium]